MDQPENRLPCIDDLIDYLRNSRDMVGNVVVVQSSDDIQSPGEYLVMDHFFKQWSDK